MKKSSNPTPPDQSTYPQIPVSVIVVTKNEEGKITRCLQSLAAFEEVIVVDSNSTDKTKYLAKTQCTRVVNYTWNGRYPKKRQWCLEQLELRHPWVFFVDADEVVQPELIEEMRRLFQKGPECAGYFIQGQYIWQGKLLRFGQRNNKLCLIDRRKIEFPPVKDLAIPGMGEIEGHYQPVLKGAWCRERIGQLIHVLHHYAQDSEAAWLARHRRYALWERGMNACNSWPKDPVFWRQQLKKIFRAAPFRPWLAFLYSYIDQLGFLDGKEGLSFAQSRYVYYRMICRPERRSSFSSTGAGSFSAASRP